MRKPIYKHDCEKCVFLGNFNNEDLYYCDQSIIPTVISRYSDVGPDYTSGMAFIGINKQLTEAYNRAIKLNLIIKK